MIDLPLLITLVLAAMIVMKIVGVIVLSWLMILLPVWIPLLLIALCIGVVGTAYLLMSKQQRAQHRTNVAANRLLHRMRR